MAALIERLIASLDAASRLLDLAAALALLAMVGLVSFGVVMRYALHAPIFGLEEIVQLSAVLLVAAALPGCTLRRAHVTVDLLEEVLGPKGRFVGNLLAHALASVVLAELCRRAVLRGADALIWGDVTNMLQLPLWPFYASLAGGAGLTALVVLLAGLRVALRGPT